MFQVKICGIRTQAELQAVAAAGADAIGLNFFPASKRYVTPAAASQLVAWLQQTVPADRRPAVVGLFVNASAAEIADVARQVPLDYLQLHGDEPPEMLNQLPALPIVKAFRCQGGDVGPVRTYLATCQRLGIRLAGVILDSAVGGAWGGTGQAADWSALAESLAQPLAVPVILAGGLDPRNVEAAVGQVRPGGVDTASGVEGPDGLKDGRKVEEFVRNAWRSLRG